MKKIVMCLFMALGISISCLFMTSLIAAAVALSGGYSFGTPEFGIYMENAVLGGILLSALVVTVSGAAAGGGLK